MKQLALYILSFTFITGSAQAADIYRHVDADGNVAYSDQPSEGANKVEVDPINIDASPKLQPKAVVNPSKDSQGPGYKALTITAPENDTTLRNASEIGVTASLNPGLGQSHRVRFLDNGKVIAPAARNMSLMVTGLERGSHQLTAEVIDKDDQVVISSAPVSVHVHRASIHQPNRATAP